MRKTQAAEDERREHRQRQKRKLFSIERYNAVRRIEEKRERDRLNKVDAEERGT
jgi:hypothetical protein